MTDTKGHSCSTKNSMFRDLFSEPGCLLELYKALHPEDTAIKEEDLKLIPLEDPFSAGINEDVVFLAKDRMIIVMEPQLTWSPNVLVRAFLSFRHAYQKHLYETYDFMYSPETLEMPFTEVYVMYPGEKGNHPDVLSMKDSFFSGQDCCFDITAHIIYADKQDTVLNQYNTFFMILAEQAKKHGKTKEAVSNAIRICREKGILDGYLGRKEQEAEEMVLYSLCLDRDPKAGR